MSDKKIDFNTPIISGDPKLSFMEAFDDYFFLHGKKYRVLKQVGENSFYVKSEKVKTNIPLNIVKVISYCTGIIPLIMFLGQIIAKSQYNFYKLPKNGERETSIRRVEKLPVATSNDTAPVFFQKEKLAATCIQSQVKGFLAKKEYQDKTLKLCEAFEDGRPAVCAWLIQEKGASFAELEAYTKTIEMTEEKTELLNWLKAATDPKKAEVLNLDHFALTLGFGYKAANLQILEQNAEKMSENLRNAVVKVPPFLPVSSLEMTQILKGSLPGVLAKWDNFLNTTFDAAAKGAFLNADSDEKAAKAGLKITKEGGALIAEIKKEILEYFKSNPYDSPQLTAWLAKTNPEFLIIRSTGKEDSDTNSNAGGNASIPYVKPNAASISAAIGEVIASYFGEKSINQRILSGDRSLFTDEKPFVPVLFQEMVGEPLNGSSNHEEIPRSGVLFTAQRDKAKGVTFIQAGLGNNEGIVSSQVAVDSYYVKEDKIHSVVRSKDTRFVSVQGKDGSITLEKIKNNNSALVKTQALPNEIISDLKRIADDISLTYAKNESGSKPMDIEYTVKLKEKGTDKPVIYLLQGRPLMDTKGEEKIEHTYLDLSELKKVPADKRFSGEVLLDGNAYVRKITSPESVIFADDLPKGADLYLHSDNPSDKKVIILKKTAPAISHESVVLRPKGVAVIAVTDPEQYAALKKLCEKASDNEPLLVDTQRGILAAASKSLSETMINKGLVSYPIPLEASIPASSIMKQFDRMKGQDERCLKDLIANFNQEADDLILALQGENELLLNSDTRELLDMMATKEGGQAKLALASLLRRLKNRLAASMKDTEDFRKSINRPMFQIFETVIADCQKEIIPALEKYPAQSLERLYPIKFLDAMIHQKMNSDVMKNPSYYQVLALDLIQTKTMEAAKQIGIKYEGPNGQKHILLHKVSDKAYSEKCSTNWLELVGDLTKIETNLSSKLTSRLLQMVSETATLNITDKWLNLVFPKAWKKYKAKPSSERAELVISELEKLSQESKKTLNWIQTRLGTLAEARQGTPNWEDPAFASKQTANIKKTFTEDLGFEKTGTGSHSIKAIYQASDEFGKLACLQYMRDAVNTYDNIIKAAKASCSYSNDQAKASQVADLLDGYFEMMESTFTLIPVTDQKSLMSTGDFSPIVYFDAYIKKLRDGFTYHFGSKKYPTVGFNNLVQKIKSCSVDASHELEARKEFTVDSLIVGSKADLNFSVHWPNTLEEYFTTFHQNMEQIVKLLNTQNGLNTGLLSNSAKKLSDQINEAFKQELSYLQVNDGKLHVGYQIPLRQHAANIVISYDPVHKEKGLDLKVQMFGNDENKRWDWAATFGSILAYTLTDGFSEDTPPQIDYSKPEGVQFSFKIPPDFKHGAKLIDAIRYITQEMTMDKDGIPSTLLDYMQKGEKEIFNGTEYLFYQGFGTIDWENLNADCFKYTLHINTTLLTKFLTDGDNEMAAKVAINSIKGLVHYGLKDYVRAQGLSLALKSVQALKKLIPTMPEIHEDIQKLIDDPDVKKLPGITSSLEQELSNAKSIL